MSGMALGSLARWLFPMSPASFASQFQCAFRFNSYIGLAVAAKLHGEAGIAAMGILIGAMVPLANMFGYVNQLRSFSQGRASYTMQFDHYEEVPANFAEKVIEASGKKLEEED